MEKFTQSSPVNDDVDVRVLGIPVVNGNPIEAGAEIAGGLIHKLAGKTAQVRQLSGIVG